MAKAIRHFVGYATFGGDVEQVQRADGVWFARHTNCTLHGYQLTKWYKQDPTWETEIVNRYDHTIVTTCEPETVMCWGFSRMREVTQPNMRLRLPD